MSDVWEVQGRYLADLSEEVPEPDWVVLFRHTPALGNSIAEAFAKYEATREEIIAGSSLVEIRLVHNGSPIARCEVAMVRDRM